MDAKKTAYIVLSVTAQLAAVILFSTVILARVVPLAQRAASLPELPGHGSSRS